MIRSIKIITGSKAGQIVTDDERFLEPFIADGKGEWFDPKVEQVPNEPKDLKEVGQTKELKQRGRKAKN